MKRILFHIDTIVASIFVFISIWLLTCTIGTNIFEPGKHDFEDFDFTDIVYSAKVKPKSPLDTNIVIINTGAADRADIAAMLHKVNAMHPAAVGMDVIFEEQREPSIDSLLIQAVSENRNIVLAAEAKTEGKTEHSFIQPYASHAGFINFFGERNYVTRYFPPFYHGDTGFAAALVRIAAPKSYEQLLARHNEEELINYTHSDSEYIVYDYQTILENELDSNALNNKIVLIGLCSRDKNDIEDMHFTPYNEVMLGKSLPDMHGIVIHANIISMMMSNNYVIICPEWLILIIEILIAWLCVAMFIYYIAKEFVWFHIAVRIFQSLSLVILSLSNILMLKYLNIKVDLRFAFLIILLSVEMLYLYEMVVTTKWFHKIFKYKSFFNRH